MRKKPFLGFFVLLAAARLGAQTADCPQTSVEQRRLADEAVRSDAARNVVREGRVRVLHVYCAEPDKETRRNVLVAVVYNYTANFATRVTLDPASRRVTGGERIAGQPQSSEEERQEALRLVREKLNFGADIVLEGGFIVDPPEGAPRDGRYIQLQVLSPDRWKLLEFITVDLSRGVVAARRRQ